MPIDLVLVRHGQSEGNIANKRSRKGDHSAFDIEAHVNRHNSAFRLTDLGIQQAISAGEWLRNNDLDHFGRNYVSEFVRARETASLLGLDNARWYIDPNLRERDWGELDNLSDQERRARFSESIRKQALTSLYWRPPNGETMAELLIRLRIIVDTLHRECTRKRVIIVCHGEVMWMWRFMLERMTQEKYTKLDASKNPKNNIHNCQIVHYTRQHPDGSGVKSERYDWVRSVCPWDESKSSNEFERIIRPHFTNDGLMDEVEKYPRIIQG